MEEKAEALMHIPVLLGELVQAIHIDDIKQNIILDATLGLGGHASHIVAKMHPGDIFIGFDADERNLKLAKKRLSEIKTQTQIVLIHSNFVSLKEQLQKYDISFITGIYYDLGVSSLHFDEASRGFSYRLNGPLDMRFDTQNEKTAADILNYYEEKDLYRIFKEYGEEPHARKIAAKIIGERKEKKFSSSFDLNIFLDSQINSHIKTKARVFQALRIEVNKELENLEKSITDALTLLKNEGNIFVISFHSLEDRIVKHIFQKEARDCICRDIICSCKHTKTIKKITKKPLIPSQGEQNNNPRSRSAKGRHAQKI